MTLQFSVCKEEAFKKRFLAQGRNVEESRSPGSNYGSEEEGSYRSVLVKGSLRDAAAFLVKRNLQDFPV